MLKKTEIVTVCETTQNDVTATEFGSELFYDAITVARDIHAVLAACLGGVYGAHVSEPPDELNGLERLRVDIEQGWAISGSLSVDLQYHFSERKMVAERVSDDPKCYRLTGQEYLPFTLCVVVSWPTSTYTVAQANAVVKIHGLLCETANLILAKYEGATIGSLYQKESTEEKPLSLAEFAETDIAKSNADSWPKAPKRRARKGKE